MSGIGSGRTRRWMTRPSPMPKVFRIGIHFLFNRTVIEPFYVSVCAPSWAAGSLPHHLFSNYGPIDDCEYLVDWCGRHGIEGFIENLTQFISVAKYSLIYLLAVACLNRQLVIN